jgi:hypothetical protein
MPQTHQDDSYPSLKLFALFVWEELSDKACRETLTETETAILQENAKLLQSIA